MKIPSYVFVFDFLFLIGLSVMHFIFSFFFKVSDFNNLFENFESYPLFNFELNTDCGTKEPIIFHTWEGWIKNDAHDDSRKNKKDILDKTNITKIYGYNFCYEKKASYKDLLYNDQIIKKGGTCKSGYKNCGTIDTLEQELCVKINDPCPLYDVRLDSVNVNSEYNPVPNTDPKIFYNNDNYESNRPNKKIIGKLVLNDGIPCYNVNEKLWNKLNTQEAVDKHLKCDIEIFGKYNDDRFEEVGKISYKKIYDDNLPNNAKQLFSSLDESYKVSLYKREFLGIDKECDSDAHITKEDYDKLVKNIKLEKYVLMVEGILVFLCIAIGLFIMIRAEAPECAVFFNIFAALIIYFICVICQSVALAKIMYYSLSYDCSDNITNELFSKENQNTQKQITYSALNLSLDIFFILIQVLLMICDVCHDEIKECCNCCNCDCTCPKCSCCPCCTCCFCCTCCPGCPCCDCTKKRINMQNIVTRENNNNNNVYPYNINANNKGLIHIGESSVNRMVINPYPQNQNVIYINPYNNNYIQNYNNYYQNYNNYYPNNNSNNNQSNFTSLDVKIKNNNPTSNTKF